MRRTLLPSPGFSRAARRIVKKNPECAPSLRAALDALAEDAFDPALKTHELEGDWKGYWSCSAGYDLRVVFEFVQHERAEAILLQTVGTHDEVF